jgi:hypothetical protein
MPFPARNIPSCSSRVRTALTRPRPRLCPCSAPRTGCPLSPEIHSSSTGKGAFRPRDRAHTKRHRYLLSFFCIAPLGEFIVPAISKFHPTEYITCSGAIVHTESRGPSASRYLPRRHPKNAGKFIVPPTNKVHASTLKALDHHLRPTRTQSPSYGNIRSAAFDHQTD